jgi:AraC family transcriptional regulator
MTVQPMRMDAPGGRILAGLLPVERLLFASDLVCAGFFRCEPTDAVFPGGQPSTAHCIVFPRTAVWIQHEGGRRFVADPSVVTLYNRGQTYWRWRISPIGDRSDWLAFPPDVIGDAIAGVAPADAENGTGRPFRFASSRMDARFYALQRRLFSRLEIGGGPDRLQTEEYALALLAEVVRRGYQSANDLRPASRRGPSRDAIEHVREILAGDPASAASLRALAGRVGWSAFHLCREFKRATGMTITAYRSELRLRTSLDRIAAGEDLMTIALDLGYSSHSHFTYAFRRLFGDVPSQVRVALRNPTPPRPT